MWIHFVSVHFKNWAWSVIRFLALKSMLVPVPVGTSCILMPSRNLLAPAEYTVSKYCNCEGGVLWLTSKWITFEWGMVQSVQLAPLSTMLQKQNSTLIPISFLICLCRLSRLYSGTKYSSQPMHLVCLIRDSWQTHMHCLVASIHSLSLSVNCVGGNEDQRRREGCCMSPNSSWDLRLTCYLISQVHMYEGQRRPE